ncbi:hypothetical protein ABMA27_012574 [Loxostege sticticalis]|uniref:Uncharacterized protein n=1 Tax=Loxostege sticticalis TaxID=481309 RepID=A0ABR3GZ34_LOXSC
MASSDATSTKKKELLAYKAKILQEIKYYDKRIEEVRSKCLKTSFVEDSDSSDSEEEFSLSIDNGPSASQLKLQQAMLRTCLQATQELTSLQVLQSEVNVLVEDPVVIGEPPVKEPGVWREVTAECRVDLVPFSITFFVHQPNRQFGQLSYRGLRVVPVKTAHEGELSKSVLPSVSRPSDAVEVIKSYAAAQRSRRTTLARLADKYANELYMEPMPDGGYILKCANLLEVSWTLQNKWSPIAAFHHRMKFDLEYMDEAYIKIITQAHRQLSDPSLETDERTLLLSKIISTCLEAQGPTQELYESMSSDPENTQTLKTRRTTLDQEPDGPGMKKKTEKELMAPPKSLPKKSKLKGKENIADNRKEKLKRGNSDENMNSVKKMRTELPEERIVSENDTKSSEKPKNKPDSAKTTISTATVENDANTNTKQTERASVASAKNTEAKKTQNNVQTEAASKDDKEKTKNAAEKSKTVKEKVDKVKETTESKNSQKEINVGKKINKPIPIKEKVTKTVEPGKNDDKTKTIKEKEIGEGDNQKNAVDTKKVPKTAGPVKNVDKNKEKSNADKLKKAINVATSKNKADSAKTTEINNKNVKEKANTQKEDKLKEIDTVKNKQPINDEVKETNKPKSKVNNQKNVKPDSKLDNQKNVVNVPNAKNKESTKIKAPSTKINTNVDNTKKVIPNKNKLINENKKTVVNNVKKPQAVNKITQDKNKPLQNAKKPIKTVSSNKIDENTIEKVVEKQSVAVKRKSNMADRTDNVTNAKKPNKPETTSNSTGKIKKTVTETKMQKITKNITPKFKSKLIPGGLKAQAGNTRVLSEIEKQNSDKKSKIPQKKLPVISENTLKKNPLRISPRKIPSTFKTPSLAVKQKTIQKTTSIPKAPKSLLLKLLIIFRLTNDNVTLCFFVKMKCHGLYGVK